MTSRAPSAAAQMFADWAAAVEDGSAPSFDELLSSHPECATELRELHADWEYFAPILNQVVPGQLSSVDAGPAGILESDAGGSSAHDSELLHNLGLDLGQGRRYGFRGVLGQGGGGIILRVWDRQLQRPLAMKIVLGRGERRPRGDTPPVDAQTITRFVDEARIASQLDHPGIVPVHELGTDSSGRAFFTMRLVRGDDLGKVFARYRKGDVGLTLDSLLRILAKACEAVAYAHEKRVVHRDLKPANIMVGRFGEVHVMDWGLARMHGTGQREAGADHQSAILSVRDAERQATPDSPLLTAQGSAVGTPAYMAPEQARGDLDAVDARSDVYAFGAMLYELIVGHPPYVPPDSMLRPEHVVLRILEGPPAPIEAAPQRAPAELVSICRKAMERSPCDRYPNVGALAADLNAYLEQRAVSVHATGPWAETRLWVRRNRALAAAAVSLLLSLTAGIVVANWLLGIQRVATLEAETRQYEAVMLGAALKDAANEFDATRQVLQTAPEHLRGWEWRYLWAESDRSEAECAAERALHILGFAHDGDSFVTRNAPYSGLSLWKSDTLERIADLVPSYNRGFDKGFICNASLHVSGRTILSTDSEGPAHLWDAITGNHLSDLGGKDGAVCVGALSNDGTLAATAGDSGIATIWDIGSATERIRVGGDGGPMHALSFTPDGESLLTASHDGSVVRWRIRDGAPIRRYPSGEGAVVGLGISKDAALMFTRSARRRVVLWDVDSGKEMWSLQHEAIADRAAANVTSAWAPVLFSPDGGSLVVQARRVLALVDTRTAAALPAWSDFPGLVHCFSKDSRHLLVAQSDGQCLVLRRTADAVPVAEYRCSARSAAIAPDGDHMFTIGGQRMRRWDILAGSRVTLLEEHSDARGYNPQVAMDPQSCLVARSGGSGGDRTAWLFDLRDGEPWAALGRPPVESKSIAVHPTEPRVLTLEGSKVSVWDRNLGIQLYGFEVEEEGRVEAAAWCARGDRIVLQDSVRAGGETSSWTTRLRVCDPVHGTPIWSNILQGGRASTAAEADGLNVAIAMENGRLMVLDAESGQVVREVAIESGEPPFLCFGRQDLVLAGFSSGCVAAWRISDGEPRAKFVGHTSKIVALCLHPDGDRVATAAGDGTVRIWSLATGRELLRIPVPSVLAGGLAWQANGEELVALAGESVLTAHVFEAASGKPYSELYRSRQRWRQEAAVLVDQLLADTGSLEVAVHRVRGNIQLAPDLRAAAEREIGRRAYRVQIAVREAERECPLMDSMRESLARRFGEDRPMLEFARRLLDQQGEYSYGVYAFARDILREPDPIDDTRLGLAFRAAKNAFELQQDAMCACAMGVALRRTGQSAEAARILGLDSPMIDWLEWLDSDDFYTAERVERLVHLALAQWDLGRPDEARATLQETAQHDSEELPESIRAWLQRARATIRR